MTLSIIDCKLTSDSITVFFSKDVTATSPTDPHSATNPNNYSVQGISPASAPQPFGLAAATTAAISYDSSRFAAHIKPFISPSSSSVPTPWPWTLLTSGSWIAVVVKNVSPATGSETPISSRGEAFPARVDGVDDPVRDTHRTTRAVEDAVAYPVLTEEVGFAPSPVATPSGASPGGRSVTSLGQTVTQAVSDVLGWKIKPDDPKAFVGALTASFTCTDVEGHTECTWTPRTYAVQTDLSGGITGAQASLYSRAQEALNQSLPLLDGLYPLNPDADAEDIAALKAVARSQLTELVNELGLAGGPRVSRINQYFQLLLQNPGTSFPSSATQFDPDQVTGTLGSLRDELGLKTTQDFVNTVQDEQDLSNFRILSDYVTSLAQSWINNLSFFGLGAKTPFFGTQLVLLSRQLSVVAESVEEVRFTLDSVFIGPADRQTLQLQFGPGDQPLFAEDLFNWVQNFATDEGPRLIQDGGKFGVRFSFLPIAQQLQYLVKRAQDPNPLNGGLPAGFHTFRVQRALKQLGDELDELVNLAAPITHVIEAPPTALDLNEMKTLLLSPRSTLVAFPPQLDFDVPSNQSARTATLFNAGNISLTITQISISDDAFGDFSCPDAFSPPKELPPLGPSQTLAVKVQFQPKTHPQAPPERYAILQVIYNGGASLFVPLNGPARGSGSGASNARSTAGSKK
jgi:hypothetical protein